jgi:hypothetical protein
VSNVGSNDRAGVPAGSRADPTPVLVWLDGLFPDDAREPVVQDGVVLTGWAEGSLHRWLRTSTGRWVGVVTLRLRTTPTRSHLGVRDGDGFLAREQLIPAEVIRLRDGTTPAVGRR